MRYYNTIAPRNLLTPFPGALEQVLHTASQTGLGAEFETAWQTAASDPKFTEAQDHERDRVYFDPAVTKAESDGLHELGQFIYYDALVMHGPGDDSLSFGGIRNSAILRANLPSLGGDETTFLNAFLDVRRIAMKAENGHQDTSRVDTMQRKFLAEGNLGLALPLTFEVSRTSFTIPKTGI